MIKPNGKQTIEGQLHDLDMIALYDGAVQGAVALMNMLRRRIDSNVSEVDKAYWWSRRERVLEEKKELVSNDPVAILAQRDRWDSEMGALIYQQIGDNMSFTPTPDFIDKEFDAYIRHDVFEGAKFPKSEHPTLVLLGGQPAASKSKAQDAIIARNPEANLVAITGDEFRPSHPNFEELAVNDPLGMPNETSSISGPLVRRCLDYAKEHGYSVLLEGTFVNQEMVLETAKEFSEAGYEVQVCAIAVSEDVSRLSAQARYLQNTENPFRARWTPPDLHDLAVVNSPGTVAALEASPYVSRVEVWNRTKQLYLNDRDSSGRWSREPEAAQVIIDERARPIENPKEWLHLYEVNAVRAAEHRIGRYAGNGNCGSECNVTGVLAKP